MNIMDTTYIVLQSSMDTMDTTPYGLEQRHATAWARWAASVLVLVQPGATYRSTQSCMTVLHAASSRALRCIDSPFADRNSLLHIVVFAPHEPIRGRFSCRSAQNETLHLMMLSALAKQLLRKWRCRGPASRLSGIPILAVRNIDSPTDKRIIQPIFPVGAGLPLLRACIIVALAYSDQTF